MPDSEFTYVEQRDGQRFRVHWQVALLVDQSFQHKGKAVDLSASGATVYLDRLLQNVNEITLHIQIPPLSTSEKIWVMEVVGKVIYSVHAADKPLFRSGIRFEKFRQSSDEGRLLNRLLSYHSKIVNPYAEKDGSGT